MPSYQPAGHERQDCFETFCASATKVHIGFAVCTPHMNQGIVAYMYTLYRHLYNVHAHTPLSNRFGVIWLFRSSCYIFLCMGPMHNHYKFYIILYDLIVVL